ncbi:MAG: hypothetical protein HOP33_08965 [Verrucomicrobia bacterium]|nr:hypothetical protein [Verrucomicrobiota bacterium]
MKTPYLILIVGAALVFPASSQVSSNSALSNIRKQIESPPLPVMVKPVRREGQSTNLPPVERIDLTDSGFRVVTLSPVRLLLSRPKALYRADELIAKYPYEDRFKERKADMVRKFDAALIEGCRTQLTNDYLRKQYRQCVAFWTTNHIEGSRIVPGAPPTNQVYFTPEVN